MAATQLAFGAQLRHWRKTRGKTQFEVSHISGYSQRHVSFLESGRSRPSRTTVITLAEALDVPVKERNTLLTAAGFAPLYSHAPIDSARLAHATAALERVIQSHRPFPAIVVDRGWNTYAANDSALALFQMFMASPLPTGGERPLNAMQLCLDHSGLRPHISNWAEFVAALLIRLRHELAFDGDDEGLQSLVHTIETDDEFIGHTRQTDATAESPLATLCLERDGRRVNLFSLISTFGTPNDATLAELRVETFFPADEHSRETLLAIDAALGESQRGHTSAVPFAAWRDS